MAATRLVNVVRWLGAKAVGGLLRSHTDRRAGGSADERAAELADALEAGELAFATVVRRTRYVEHLAAMCADARLSEDGTRRELEARLLAWFPRACHVRPQEPERMAAHPVRLGPPTGASTGDWRWRATGEMFEFYDDTFDIDLARELVAGRPRHVRTIVNVAELASFRGRYFAVRRATSARYRLDVPLLVATVAAGHVVIDGWHRIVKAADESVATLPAGVLTGAETKVVKAGRRGRGWGRGRRRR